MQSAAYDLGDALHQQHMAAALVDCVAALPLAQREVYVLFNEQELSLDAIAQMVDAPTETVKSRLRYARQSVRQTMEVWR